MGRSKLNINRNKMKILILAAFIALTSIAICESASGFSYFFTPRRGPIAKSSSITPAHHGYKHVVHPYRSRYRAHPKKIHTYVQPKKTHIYVAPKMTPTYSHPKKTYGFKLIGEVHSGEASLGTNQQKQKLLRLILQAQKKMNMIIGLKIYLAQRNVAQKKKNMIILVPERMPLGTSFDIRSDEE